MTSRLLTGHRFDHRRLWLLVAIVAAVAACACALTASLVLGAPAPPVSTPAAPTTSSSASAAPATARVRARVVPMPRSVPTRLRIPAIGVDSSLMDLGLEKDGTLETPPSAFPAGWFTGAPTPGEMGPAIIVGHVRYTTPGVFEHLTDLRSGDRVAVRRADGSTARFRIREVEHFAKSAFPTKKVYGNLDHPGLRLITCGRLDASTNTYEENVVVFADLVQE